MPTSQSLIDRAKAILENNPTIGRNSLAEELDISTDRARHILDKVRVPGSAKPPKQPKESIEENGDSLSVHLDGVPIRTLEELISYAKIDTQKWEVERFIANKWEMGAIPRATRAKGKEKWTRPVGTPIIKQLFQIKAWFRKRVVMLAIAEEIAALKAEAKKHAPVFKPVRYRTSEKSGNMVEIDLPDAHLGRLSWSEESGYGDYDLKIGTKDFENTVDGLIARTERDRPERVLLVLGNDLMNSDGPEGNTTAGTRQDNDSRYPKMFRRTRELTTRIIERIHVACPVDVLIVPGNHDTKSSWHLGDSLECWFHNCKDVTINNAPIGRKFYEWGRVMLMFVHGDKGKQPDYPLLMATEQPLMWSRTKYRECHTGHIHTLRTNERNGVRVRALSSLTAPDYWSSSNHYVGNLRCGEAFVWNKKDGLVGTATVTIEPDRP